MIRISFFIPLFFWLTSAYAQEIFPEATPESQGLSSSSLNALVDEVNDYFNINRIIGAELLVIKNRHTVLHETVGWIDREAKIPMPKDTVFNIRSMTKPLTGIAIQMLIDDGLLELSDPAAKYITGFNTPESESITIEQLLTHRSGLPLSILASLQGITSLQSYANAAGETGPELPPGSKFWYSDTGTDVLGAIIETISGQPLNQFITERVLHPLGMNNSFSYQTDISNNELMDRLAPFYLAQSNGTWLRYPYDNGIMKYPFPLGAQSVFSTPKDYARFLTMVMDNGMTSDGIKLLSDSAIERIMKPVSIMTNLGQDTRAPTGFPGLSVFYSQMMVLYCQNMNTSPMVFGHSGSDGTWAWAWPKEDLMVLYFTQSRGMASGVTLETEIDRYLIPQQDKPPIPEMVQDYIGTYSAYSSQAKQTITRHIIVQNDRLSLVIPGVFVFDLRDADKLGRWITEMTNSIWVQFYQDSQNQVTSMRYYESGLDLTLQKTMIPTDVRDWEFY